MAPMSPVEIYRLVVGNIRRARVKRGLSQEYFALALDLPKWRLVDIESGVEVADPAIIIRAVAILHLEIAELFADPQATARAA